MTNNNDSYNYIPQTEISEENSFGVSSSVEYKRKEYVWERFVEEDTKTDYFTEEFIDDSPGRSPQGSNTESSANASEDKMCRICFAGSEEESNLGRLISPCQCKGTMRVNY
jgi:hypothetical protein